MATKTPPENPMTASDRRTFLQKSTVALGFLPLAGCFLDSEGVEEVKNKLDNSDDSERFQGTTVGLRIASVRQVPADGLIPGVTYTLKIDFEADVTGVGIRTDSESRTNDQLLTLPHDVTTSSIIMLSESGSVSCKCTFTYDPPATLANEVYELTQQKAADAELPWFKLIFVDPIHELVSSA